MGRTYLIEHKVIYKTLLSLGLSDSEASYVVNVVTNAVRQCGADDGCFNFRFSVDGKQDLQYEQSKKNGCCSFYDKEILLQSGRFVKFGFNYGF